MKKHVWTGTFAAALTLSLCATAALAAEVQAPGSPGWNAGGAGMYFVDEDGDGVCDRYASGLCGGGYGRGAGRGGQGLGTHGCRIHLAPDGTWVHCADADGDGVCDTCGGTLPAGCGFVDEDGDGVCDRAPAGGGAGRQRGCRGGWRSAAGA